LAIFSTDGDFRRFAKCLPIVLHEFKKTGESASLRPRRPSSKQKK
jgi:hypothetical protein